ncbi:MAG: hypothetical protein V4436_02010 [Patescibacteria group bacterium]
MAKKIDTTFEDTSKKLGELLNLYPIDLSEPKETTMAMREALARLYSDPAIRAFLENAVKYANRSLISAISPEQHIFYKSRIETLLQLLNMGKQHFVHFEMRQARKEPLRSVEMVVPEIKL